MIIIKEKRVNEKLNNFAKVIEATATQNTVNTLRDLVNRNQNMKPFFDAGGKPALVLAYIIGVIKGIESFIAFSFNVNQNEHLPVKGTVDYLLQAKAEAFTTLKDI